GASGTLKPLTTVVAASVIVSSSTRRCARQFYPTGRRYVRLGAVGPFLKIITARVRVPRAVIRVVAVSPSFRSFPDRAARGPVTARRAPRRRRGQPPSPRRPRGPRPERPRRPAPGYRASGGAQ